MFVGSLPTHRHTKSGEKKPIEVGGELGKFAGFLKEEKKKKLHTPCSGGRQRYGKVKEKNQKK